MSQGCKVCFVLIDGIGDVGIPALDRKTPLQKSNTHNMDFLAKHGLNGLMDPVEPGLACGSDTAHMSIFGYEPRKHYKGRGSFESIGAGLDMIKGDIAFKCNFATFDHSSGLVVSRRADRDFEHLGPELCSFLEKSLNPFFIEFQGKEIQYEIAVKYATEHRCGVRVRGPGLCGETTGTDPLRDNLPLLKSVPTPNYTNDIDAQRTSAVVNALSDRVFKLLTSHPINDERRRIHKQEANIVLLRGCGVMIDVPTFDIYHNLRSFMVAPTAIIAGLGKSVHMHLLKVPGATGDYHTDLQAKANGFCDFFVKNQSEYDFGFCHVKAVDDAGHDGNYELKISFLEKCDEMIGTLYKRLKQELNEPVIFIVTGDHSTPCLYKDHSHEPVPFVICGNHVQDDSTFKFGDSASAFNEIDSARGLLGRFTGLQVFDIINNYIKHTVNQSK
ncbi:2,3-bisphosphoglycerate-independent phosphoglycerate mutase [Acrasis kona]|uniref:2,3-bisphosphoglycerate-independent phosphoglycerate mutase n=1 Tax=Acrasis kona TaxID=1008807 RepID=A0AAW2ZLL2_9EUKA